MALSGKYDFKGIKRLGAANLRGLLASSPYFAWLLSFGALTDLFLEFLANYAANRGLVILNIGANYGAGFIDQRDFDSAMQKALSEIELKGGRSKLTPTQKKVIDDAVIKAARKFIVVGKS